MKIDNNTLKKTIKISGALLCAAFTGLSVVGRIKKHDSVYDNEISQKNPFENKKVVFVEDEGDPENADGVKGHLEAVDAISKNRSFYDKYIKRCLDITLSFGGLVALSPIYAALALAIKIDDPGPVLFTQKRVGQNKEFFKLHKFRSMKMSTPHDVPTHMLDNPEQYITRVGKLLRKYSLDELPQIWDIFIGNMSVIGPRPALWNQDVLIAQRDKYFANDVKPGLTGWAQINGRDELEIDVKAKLDGEYAEKVSFGFDAKCFLGTILSVAKHDGVVEGGTGAMSKNDNVDEKPRLLLVANVAKEHVLKFHIPTIKMLKEQGWHVDVACSGEEEVPFCDNQFHMSYKRSPFNPDLIKGIAELKEIVDKGNYDIIYCHTPVGGLAARLASEKARKNGSKVIYCAHGYHFFKGAPLVNWLIYYPMEKALSLMTDAIVLINKEDYNFTKEHFKNCEPYLINGIGVNTDRFDVSDKENVRKQYREELNIPEDATVLIYLAELLKNKNQTFLMRVLKKLIDEGENVYLVLAGFDHSDGSFAEYAQQLGIADRVRILGWREDVSNLYMMSDICTATSIREGFGLNLVEAMSCGIPVVATRNRGHETIINDGENGFLVDLGDEEEFSKRIIQLMHDDAIKQKFIQTGLNEWDKYKCENVLNDIYSILYERTKKDKGIRDYA